MPKAIQLDEKLDFFNGLLLQMVSRVEESILKATVAFRDQDTNLAEKVVAEDYFIDQLRDMIENDSVRLLISEAPYGHYMRYVVAGLKMVTSLERMGDHAAHLAGIASHIDKENKTEKQVVDKIVAMANADARMFRKAIEALMEKDGVAAVEVSYMDSEIDEFRFEINNLIFSQGDARNPNMYEYFYIVKELERIGDHITTICSWIVYMTEGKKPKLDS